MSRLIVFGCSYAYGFALDDCNEAHSPPSKFCWPVFIADAMNRELVNMSKPASSNKRIWHTISTFKFQPTDLVIISWSYGNRSCIINNPWNIKNLINHTDDVEAVAYYEHIHSWYDSLLMSKLFVKDANQILNEMGLQVYNLFTNRYWADMLKSNYNTIPLYMEEYITNYPKALDNMHPGLEANRAFAVDFMNHIGVSHSIKDIQKPYTFFERLKHKLCK